MQEKYSPADMTPDGTLGAITWGEVWENIQTAGKEKVQEVAVTAVQAVGTKPAGPAPTPGVPVQTVVIQRDEENAFTRFARENPMLLLGGAAALVALLAWRRR